MSKWINYKEMKRNGLIYCYAKSNNKKREQINAPMCLEDINHIAY